MRFTDGKEIILTFEDSVISCFKRYRQSYFWNLEAGGQLYTNRKGNNFLICKATGPKQADKRGKFFFLPNRKSEQEEIDKYFRLDLFFAGDWHTHPELKPIPSLIDLQNIRECFIKSTHSLEYFLLVIVGKSCFPEGLSVSLHNADQHIFLIPYKVCI